MENFIFAHCYYFIILHYSLPYSHFILHYRLDETINIGLNETFVNKQFVSNFDRDSFEKLLRFATKRVIFQFFSNGLS